MSKAAVKIHTKCRNGIKCKLLAMVW